MNDPILTRESVTGFLDRLASNEPTPGGGSVAALAGALGAALGRMVCQFTLGRPKFAAVQEQVRGLAQRLERADGMLRGLIDEDAAAYELLSAALKLDKSDAGRAARVQQAAELAAGVPLSTAAVCAEVLAELRQLETVGNQMLRSDVQAGQHLVRAGLRAAAANVEANLPLMASDAAGGVKEQIAALLARDECNRQDHESAKGAEEIE